MINQDGQIIGGHQRKRVMMVNGYTAAELVDVRVPSRQLTEREAAELNVRLNRNAGAWDWDILANEFEIDDLKDWGFKPYELGIAGAADVNEMWEGMPEFGSEDMGPVRTIKVNFATQGDVEIFAELLGQKITDKTRSIWYPEVERLDLTSEAYRDES